MITEVLALARNVPTNKTKDSIIPHHPELKHLAHGFDAHTFHCAHHTAPNLNNADCSGEQTSRSSATPTRETTCESVDGGVPEPEVLSTITCGASTTGTGVQVLRAMMPLSSRLMASSQY